MAPAVVSKMVTVAARLPVPGSTVVVPAMRTWPLVTFGFEKRVIVTTSSVGAATRNRPHRPGWKVLPMKVR